MSTSENPMPLFVSIEPREDELRLELFHPKEGSKLRARLPSTPAQGSALVMLLEGLSLWFGRPLRAVLDAGASDVQAHPERWAAMLGDAHEQHVVVEWIALPDSNHRDRFLCALGRSPRGERLVSFAGTGAP